MLTLNPLKKLCFAVLICMVSSSALASAAFEIRSGDTLYSLLKKHRFTETQVRKILSQKPLPKSFQLVPGETYRTVAADNKVELKLFGRQGNTSFNFWRAGKDQAGFEKRAENYQIKQITKSGRVNGSIIASINALTKDKSLAYRFLDAYVFDYKLKRALQRGAKFQLTYQELYLDGQFIKNGEVLNTSLEIGDQTVERTLISYPRGGATFVDPLKSQSERSFYAPVDYVTISSVYQKRRFHPIKRRRQAHLGVDFALPTGSPVYSTYPGRIIKKGRSRGAGRYVAVRHPNGLESYYNHLNSIEPNLKVGQYVSNGEQIGTVGCTGYCTKPHLHFAIKKNGRFIDPLTVTKSYPFTGKFEAERIFSKAEVPGKRFSRR